MGNCTCTDNTIKIEDLSLPKSAFKETGSYHTEKSPRNLLLIKIQSLIRGYISRKSCRITLMSDSLQSLYNALPLFRSTEASSISYFFEGGVYEGEVNKINQVHGAGKLIRSNCIREGSWVNGKLHGYCRVVSESEVFTGNFVEDIKEGYGENKGNTEYKGEYKGGKPHGKGCETWADGSVYQGCYLEGVRTGFGVFLWPNGNKYVGEFKHNKIKGTGEIFMCNGNYYKGQWAGNKMHGIGRFVWNNGKVYEGGYFKGKKQGFGVLEWKGGKFEGMWKGGKQHGEGFMLNKGSKKEGIWHSGKFVSTCS